MSLRIKYFGMTAEAIGVTEVELSENFSTVKELRDVLLRKHPKLSEINFMIAVNQEIVGDNHDLIGNEEVALLPPFAGG